MKSYQELPILIVGAGISGLWLLNRLHQLGVPAYLIEKESIGSGQTIASQGIIHGGTKFALSGKLNKAASSVSTMTDIWDSCFMGEGEINLSHVNFLSETHYLWLKSQGSALKSFISSKVLHADNAILQKKDYPPLFKAPAFRGSICALHEKVLDIPSLLRELAKPVHDYILQSSEESEFHFTDNGEISSVTLQCHHERLTLKAKHYIFTAGNGNASPFKQIINAPLMQQRPLKMVSVAFNRQAPEETFCHIIEKGQTPTLTITTHKTNQGKTLWYLGGELAEAGVHLSDDEQIEKTKKELSRLLPWVNLEDTQIKVHTLMRAENDNNGARPSHPFVKNFTNTTIAWPIKLTLAPGLTKQILASLPAELLTPMPGQTIDWPKANLAKSLWDGEIS